MPLILKICQLLTVLSQLTGEKSFDLPFRLKAEKNKSVWVFSQDNSTANLTKKQGKEVKFRLQRRIRKFRLRLAKKHQSFIDREVKVYGDRQYNLPYIIASIQTQNPLKDTINKYLTLIHYKELVDKVYYKGITIASRVDDGSKNYILQGAPTSFDDFPIPIGMLALCPDIIATEEILVAVATLWKYITGNSTENMGKLMTMGELMTYQQNNPLVNISLKPFNHWAQGQCKHGCLCFDCRSRIAQCQSCLDDGCEDCEVCFNCPVIS